MEFKSKKHFLAFKRFLEFCGESLDQDAPQITKVLKINYESCGEETRNSDKMVDLLESTMENMKKEPSRAFVHLKGLVSQLKQWSKAKPPLSKMDTSENKNRTTVGSAEKKHVGEKDRRPQVCPKTSSDLEGNKDHSEQETERELEIPSCSYKRSPRSPVTDDCRVVLIKTEILDSHTAESVRFPCKTQNVTISDGNFDQASVIQEAQGLCDGRLNSTIDTFEKWELRKVKERPSTDSGSSEETETYSTPPERPELSSLSSQGTEEYSISSEQTEIYSLSPQETETCTRDTVSPTGNYSVVSPPHEETSRRSTTILEVNSKSPTILDIQNVSSSKSKALYFQTDTTSSCLESSLQDHTPDVIPLNLKPKVKLHSEYKNDSSKSSKSNSPTSDCHVNQKVDGDSTSSRGTFLSQTILLRSDATPELLDTLPKSIGQGAADFTNKKSFDSNSGRQQHFDKLQVDNHNTKRNNLISKGSSSSSQVSARGCSVNTSCGVNDRSGDITQRECSKFKLNKSSSNSDKSSTCIAVAVSKPVHESAPVSHERSQSCQVSDAPSSPSEKLSGRLNSEGSITRVDSISSPSSTVPANTPETSLAECGDMTKEKAGEISVRHQTESKNRDNCAEIQNKGRTEMKEATECEIALVEKMVHAPENERNLQECRDQFLTVEKPKLLQRESAVSSKVLPPTQNLEENKHREGSDNARNASEEPQHIAKKINRGETHTAPETITRSDLLSVGFSSCLQDQIVEKRGQDESKFESSSPILISPEKSAETYTRTRTGRDNQQTSFNLSSHRVPQAGEKDGQSVSEKCRSSLKEVPAVKPYKRATLVPVLSKIDDSHSLRKFNVASSSQALSNREWVRNKPSSSKKSINGGRDLDAGDNSSGDEFVSTSKKTVKDLPKETQEKLSPEEQKHQKHIRKLENLLETLRDEIEKCQARELSVEDLEAEDSSYIYEDKLKKKFVDVWNKLCELTKRTVSTGRPTERTIRFNSTRYKEINRRLERFLNKTKSFPDIHDVRHVIKLTNSKYKLGLSSPTIQNIAREAFVDIGEMLQSRRHEDFIATFGTRETDAQRSGSCGMDPYWTDPALRRKLDNNRKTAESNLEKVIAKYTQLQESRKGKDDDDDVDEEDDDVEEEVERVTDKKKKGPSKSFMDDEEEEEEEGSIHKKETGLSKRVCTRESAGADETVDSDTEESTSVSSPQVTPTKSRPEVTSNSNSSKTLTALGFSVNRTLSATMKTLGPSSYLTSGKHKITTEGSRNPAKSPYYKGNTSNAAAPPIDVDQGRLKYLDTVGLLNLPVNPYLHNKEAVGPSRPSASQRKPSQASSFCSLPSSPASVITVEDSPAKTPNPKLGADTDETRSGHLERIEDIEDQTSDSDSDGKSETDADDDDDIIMVMSSEGSGRESDSEVSRGPSPVSVTSLISRQSDDDRSRVLWDLDDKGNGQEDNVIPSEKSSGETMSYNGELYEKSRILTALNLMRKPETSKEKGKETRLNVTLLHIKRAGSGHRKDLPLSKVTESGMEENLDNTVMPSLRKKSVPKEDSGESKSKSTPTSQVHRERKTKSPPHKERCTYAAEENTNVPASEDTASSDSLSKKEITVEAAQANSARAYPNVTDSKPPSAKGQQDTLHAKEILQAERALAESPLQETLRENPESPTHEGISEPLPGIEDEDDVDMIPPDEDDVDTIPPEEDDVDMIPPEEDDVYTIPPESPQCYMDVVDDDEEENQGLMFYSSLSSDCISSDVAVEKSRCNFDLEQPDADIEGGQARQETRGSECGEAASTPSETTPQLATRDAKSTIHACKSSATTSIPSDSGKAGSKVNPPEEISAKTTLYENVKELLKSQSSAVATSEADSAERESAEDSVPSIGRVFSEDISNALSEDLSDHQKPGQIKQSQAFLVKDAGNAVTEVDDVTDSEAQGDAEGLDVGDKPENISSVTVVSGLSPGHKTEKRERTMLTPEVNPKANEITTDQSLKKTKNHTDARASKTDDGGTEQDLTHEVTASPSSYNKVSNMNQHGENSVPSRHGAHAKDNRNPLADAKKGEACGKTAVDIGESLAVSGDRHLFIENLGLTGCGRSLNFDGTDAPSDENERNTVIPPSECRAESQNDTFSSLMDDLVTNVSEIVQDHHNSDRVKEKSLIASTVPQTQQALLEDCKAKGTDSVSMNNPLSSYPATGNDLTSAPATTMREACSSGIEAPDETGDKNGHVGKDTESADSGLINSEKPSPSEDHLNANAPQKDLLGSSVEETDDASPGKNMKEANKVGGGSENCVKRNQNVLVRQENTHIEMDKSVLEESSNNGAGQTTRETDSGGAGPYIKPLETANHFVEEEASSTKSQTDQDLSDKSSEVVSNGEHKGEIDSDKQHEQTSAENGGEVDSLDLHGKGEKPEGEIPCATEAPEYAKTDDGKTETFACKAANGNPKSIDEKSDSINAEETDERNDMFELINDICNKIIECAAAHKTESGSTSATESVEATVKDGENGMTLEGSRDDGKKPQQTGSQGEDAQTTNTQDESVVGDTSGTTVDKNEVATNAVDQNSVDSPEEDVKIIEELSDAKGVRVSSRSKEEDRKMVDDLLTSIQSEQKAQQVSEQQQQEQQQEEEQQQQEEQPSLESANSDEKDEREKSALSSHDSSAPNTEDKAETGKLVTETDGKADSLQKSQGSSEEEKDISSLKNSADEAVASGDQPETESAEPTVGESTSDAAETAGIDTVTVTDSKKRKNEKDPEDSAGSAGSESKGNEEEEDDDDDIAITSVELVEPPAKRQKTIPFEPDYITTIIKSVYRGVPPKRTNVPSTSGPSSAGGSDDIILVEDSASGPHTSTSAGVVKPVSVFKNHWQLQTPSVKDRGKQVVGALASHSSMTGPNANVLVGRAGQEPQQPQLPKVITPKPYIPYGSFPKVAHAAAGKFRTKQHLGMGRQGSSTSASSMLHHDRNRAKLTNSPNLRYTPGLNATNQTSRNLPSFTSANHTSRNLPGFTSANQTSRNLPSFNSANYMYSQMARTKPQVQSARMNSSNSPNFSIHHGRDPSFFQSRQNGSTARLSSRQSFSTLGHHNLGGNPAVSSPRLMEQGVSHRAATPYTTAGGKSRYHIPVAKGGTPPTHSQLPIPSNTLRSVHPSQQPAHMRQRATSSQPLRKSLKNLDGARIVLDDNSDEEDATSDRRLKYHKMASRPKETRTSQNLVPKIVSVCSLSKTNAPGSASAAPHSRTPKNAKVIDHIVLSDSD